MKPLHLLSGILLLFGLVIALVPQNTTKPYKLTAEQLLSELKAGTQFVSPDELADKIIKKDPSIQPVDVRNPRAFDQFHLPGAINIPLQDLLSAKYTDILNQGTRMNVFYSNGSVESTEAWLLTRQLGYQNNYILQGGLNYWMEAIISPQKPGSLSPDEELARYDFRKAASMMLGGGGGGLVPTASDNKSPGPKPGIIPVIGKKKPSGGC